MKFTVLLVLVEQKGIVDDKEKKEFAKADRKMKYGKRWKEFAKDAESAKKID